MAHGAGFGRAAAGNGGADASPVDPRREDAPVLPSRPRRSLRPLRPRLPRRAVLWYLAAAALAAVTALVVQGALDRAARAEAAYGSTRPVAVVTRDVEAGTTLGPDDVELRPWPRALVPAEALGEAPDGRTALVDLASGEPLLADRVSGSDGDGPAALLGPGQRALPVPLAVPGLALAVGDHVDVLAGGAAGGGPTGDLPVDVTSADVVATDATVVDPGQEVAVLAVDRTAAATIAAALATGPVVLALRPPGG